MSDIHLSSAMSDIHLSTTKTAPKFLRPSLEKAINPHIKYELVQHPESSNILILLHGRGDTHKSFAQLGKNLNLPQTDVLAIRAPLPVPLLEEEDCFEWYPEMDFLAQPVPPNPSKSIEVLRNLINHLMQDCNYPSTAIHIFGYGQGGSLALQFALSIHQLSLADLVTAIGSIVSVQGPLISTPTSAVDSETPVMIWQRGGPSLTSSVTSGIQKGFKFVQSHVVSGGQGMPRTREEWEPVMKFWSERLVRRNAWEKEEGVYQVSGGIPASVHTTIGETGSAALESVQKPTTGPKSTTENSTTQTPSKKEAPKGLKKGFFNR